MSPVDKEAAMKILVGVDDSRHARAALDYVRTGTWPGETQVHIVSVARPPIAAVTEVYAPAPQYLERVQEEQINLCKSIAEKAKKNLEPCGLEISTHVLQGDPREALLDTAKEIGVDLIVIGSHGRTGLAKLLMGSVASHIVTHSPCNVLVVKLPQKAT
jgi:nucleotide-binding universal stress UspA family protein